jgi:hypothetical protein
MRPTHGARPQGLAESIGAYPARVRLGWAEPPRSAPACAQSRRPARRAEVDPHPGRPACVPVGEADRGAARIHRGRPWPQRPGAGSRHRGPRAGPRRDPPAQETEGRPAPPRDAWTRPRGIRQRGRPRGAVAGAPPTRPWLGAPRPPQSGASTQPIRGPADAMPVAPRGPLRRPSGPASRRSVADGDPVVPPSRSGRPVDLTGASTCTSGAKRSKLPLLCAIPNLEV